MEIHIEKDYQKMSHRAASFVAERMRAKPDLVLGLHTGSTPIGMYAELVRMHTEDGLDFSGATIFNLDEYVGLSADHPQSYQFYMHEHLLSKVNARDENIFLMNEERAGEYEGLIRDHGGIDLQTIGIGGNAHIGFNEPGSSFDSRTRVIDLTEATIESNSRFFDDASEVPRKAVTMGIATIMDAREVLFLAARKYADVVARAFEGPVTPDIPASVLQNHPHCAVMLDEAAASKLSRVN